MRRALVAVLTVLVAACSPQDANEAPDSTTPTTTTTSTTELPLPTAAPPAPPMELTSPSFARGEPIPEDFTCDGKDVSPQLDISGIPDQVESLALIVADPDAPVGTWVHWVTYDIEEDGEEMTVPEATGPLGVRGVNSWNIVGYRGPCPPEGEEHRYFFKVYALDTLLRIPAEVTAGELETAIEGHVLIDAELMGTYAR